MKEVTSSLHILKRDHDVTKEKAEKADNSIKLTDVRFI